MQKLKDETDHVKERYERNKVTTDSIANGNELTKHISLLLGGFTD
jgi:hypothetical protein